MKYKNVQGVELLKLPSADIESDILGIIGDNVGSYKRSDRSIGREVKKGAVKHMTEYWIDQDQALEIAMDSWTLAKQEAKEVSIFNVHITSCSV